MITVLATLVLLGNAHAQFAVPLNPEQTQEEQERQIEVQHYQNQMMEQQRADQGDSNAQDNLGVLYYMGQGVPQDYVRAHMWFNLAAAGGDKVAARHRDIVAAKMTPAQIAEAQKLAREWKPTTQRPQ